MSWSLHTSGHKDGLTEEQVTEAAQAAVDALAAADVGLDDSAVLQGSIQDPDSGEYKTLSKRISPSEGSK